MNDVYVNYGLYRAGWRRWEDATTHGFLCAGGGRHYSDPLRLITDEDRLWVYVPGWGYAGAAVATGPVQRANVFRIGQQSIRSVLGGWYANDTVPARRNDPDLCEYFLPVRWLETRDLHNAVGYGRKYYSNPTVVCRPTHPRWDRTLPVLRKTFPLAASTHC